MTTLTQFSSFLFTLTYPFSFFLVWLSTTYYNGLPVRVWPSLLLSVVCGFFYRSDLTLLSAPPLLPYCVLTELRCPRTTSVYPSPPLQTLWVHPYTPCNTPSMYWAYASMGNTDSHLSGSIQTVPCIHLVAHTQILKTFFVCFTMKPCFILHQTTMRDWYRHCHSDATCAVP